jgi:hypothetical protein
VATSEGLTRLELTPRRSLGAGAVR